MMHINSFGLFSVPNHMEGFNYSNIHGFNFPNGYKCSDAYILENLLNSTKNFVELSFYQEEKGWKHNLFPFELTKNKSDGVVDLFYIQTTICSHQKNIIIL